MRREFLARREAKQCNVHLVVLMQDAAQDPIFWQCEFLQQVGKKCIVHKLLLLVPLQCLMRLNGASSTLTDPLRASHGVIDRSAIRMRLNYTCLQSVARSRSVGVLGPADRSEEHTSELQSLRHLVCR